MYPPQSKATARMRTAQRLQETRHKDLAAAAQKSAKNRCRAAPGTAPLELLVVGHQLHMHPMAYTLAPTALGRSRCVQRPLAKAVRHPARATNQVQMKLDEGEFVYIYESFPAQFWPPQLYFANDGLPVIDEPNALPPQPVPLPLQVVDARFLAELLDELLMREE